MRPLPIADINQDFYCSFYNTLSSYEHHFNMMEFEVRKLASYWLVLIFGAVAFIVRGDLDAHASLAPSASLLCLIALFGNAGLFALWCLDQRVYHSLLNAAFSIGLEIERLRPEIPPVRSKMWENSKNAGMTRFGMLFYVLPMGVIGFVGIFGAARVGLATGPKLEPVIAAVVALLIPLWIAIPWVKVMPRFFGRKSGLISPETEPDFDAANLSANAAVVLARWNESIPDLAHLPTASRTTGGRTKAQIN